jgi:pilus assembly protein CpaC
MSTRLRFIIALCAGAAVALPGIGRAAPPQLLTTATSGMELEVGQGQIIHLDKPATSVFLADPNIADVEVKSPMLIYIYGKASGATTLYAVGDHDNVLLNSSLHVHYDVARLERAIHDLVPHSAVSVNAVDSSIVLSGTVTSAAEGDDIRRVAAGFVPQKSQLLDELKVDAPNQVNLRVRFAEVSRDIVKQFGINWQNLYNNGTAVFGLFTAAQTLIPVGAPANAAKVVPTIPGNGNVAFNTQGQALLGGATVNNLFGGVRLGNSSINALIDALDNHGLVSILAEPNLSAVSGEPAKFLAGGEFPIPVAAGLGVTGIEWKSFGVSLTFIATIAGDDRISLRVEPEVSQLSNSNSVSINGLQVPSLTTRRADTTVEMASGQSFAIAGLIQNTLTQQLNKFPWLGDVPILGQLFRSEAFQRDESELVIIVTPYIVHPIETADRAALPTDGLVTPTDGQFIAHANEFQPQAPKPDDATAGHNLVGPVGFSLE